MNFGSSAVDYAAHRRGFPASLVARLPLAGRVLDLGSGTGTLAAMYAAGGARVSAVDVSREMLRQGPASYAKVVARAEALPFGAGAFDAVIAGQCWHWFDGPRAARECARVVRSGGVVAIAHLDYVLAAGGVAEATEALILEANPRWTMAGGDGRHETWRPHLEGAGVADVESFWYDEVLEYDHAAWRGRIRACNGVMAIADAEARAEVDRRLGDVLAARFPGTLAIPHRVFAIFGRAP